MSSPTNAYFNMAKRDLVVAKDILSLHSEDESYFGYAAYHLQQCVENALNHCVEIAGQEFPRTHNIAELCDIVTRNKVSTPFSISDVIDVADALAPMEDAPRYTKNFSIELSLVQRFLALAEACVQGLKDAEWEEWAAGARAFAGREVTDEEILLFGRFGHTNLSQVSDAELDELEADIDAGRF